jgi:hypothetical protein
MASEALSADDRDPRPLGDGARSGCAAIMTVPERTGDAVDLSPNFALAHYTCRSCIASRRRGGGDQRDRSHDLSPSIR